MQITSNLAGVIRQVQRLKANVPVATARVLTPARWETSMKGTAVRTMESLAKPEEKQYIPGFIRTLLLMPLEQGGLSVSMHKPDTEKLRAPGAIFGAKQGEAGYMKDFGTILFDMPIPEFKNLIEAWVSTPKEEGGKDWDRRDPTRTDEGEDEVAQHIADVMLSPNDKAKSARAGLLPHILEFMRQRMPELSAETIDLWLRAVLAAWSELVRREFPVTLRQELQKMKAEL